MRQTCMGSCYMKYGKLPRGPLVVSADSTSRNILKFRDESAGLDVSSCRMAATLPHRSDRARVGGSMPRVRRSAGRLACNLRCKT